MKKLAALFVLGDAAGMVSDSSSFLNWVVSAKINLQLAGYSCFVDVSPDTKYLRLFYFLFVQKIDNITVN